MTSLSKVEKPPVPFNNYIYRELSYERNWEIGVNYKTKFYLTKKEVRYFLDQIKKKKRIVLVGGIVLTNRFDYIAEVYVEKPLEPGEVRIYGR